MSKVRPRNLYLNEQITKQILHSSVGKASACNVGGLGSIPGLGRSPGEANGNPLQFSCLENLMDRGTWKATGSWDHKSRTRLSTIFRQIATLHMIF